MNHKCTYALGQQFPFSRIVTAEQLLKNSYLVKIAVCRNKKHIPQFLHTPGPYIKMVFFCPLGYFEMFHLHMLHTSHIFKEFQIQKHLWVHSKTSGGSTEKY